MKPNHEVDFKARKYIWIDYLYEKIECDKKTQNTVFGPYFSIIHDYALDQLKIKES